LCHSAREGEGINPTRRERERTRLSPEKKEKDRPGKGKAERGKEKDSIKKEGGDRWMPTALFEYSRREEIRDRRRRRLRGMLKPSSQNEGRLHLSRWRREGGMLLDERSGETPSQKRR